MKIGSIFGLLFVVALGPPPSGAEAQGEPQVLALTNANVIDGVSEQPIRQATVIVRDGKIVSVATATPNIPTGATVIDLKGMWLLPGLIDAHVHFTDLAAARIALSSGVTTVRTGSSTRFIDVGIRELNHAGIANVPDVVAAGYQVVRQPPEVFFLDFPKMLDLMQGVRGPENVRRMVRALAERGVNVIKILATERAGLPQTDPRRRTFTDEELAAATDEAKRSGLAVMAHAHGDEGAAAAVRAGVRTIEHGTYLSDQTLALMKERGTYLVPTFTTTMREEGDAIVAARQRANLPRRRAMTARALKLGVRIVAATDIEYDDKYRLQDEIVEFVRLGMSPMGAIKSATTVAAECLTIDARTGAIKPGLEADLIVVEGDPLADIEAIRDVILVLNNGKVAVNRLNP
jgi:imidazolonepropionase-like amidohydrolase